MWVQNVNIVIYKRLHMIKFCSAQLYRENINKNMCKEITLEINKLKFFMVIIESSR